MLQPRTLCYSLLLSVGKQGSLSRGMTLPMNQTYSSVICKAHAPCWLKSSSSNTPGGMLNLCRETPASTQRAKVFLNMLTGRGFLKRTNCKTLPNFCYDAPKIYLRLHVPLVCIFMFFFLAHLYAFFAWPMKIDKVMVARKCVLVVMCKNAWKFITFIFSDPVIQVHAPKKITCTAFPKAWQCSTHVWMGLLEKNSNPLVVY